MPFLRRSASARPTSDDRSKPLEPLGSYAAAPSVEPSKTILEKAASAEDVKRLFGAFFQTGAVDQSFADMKRRSGISIIGLVEELIHSPEVWIRLHEAKTMSGGSFRVPSTLKREGMIPDRVLLIGSCAIDIFYDQLLQRSGRTCFTKITFNNGSTLPPLANEEAVAIDFQLVQLPIRAIMPEQMYLNGHVSEQTARSSFAVSRSLLRINFDAASSYNLDHGVQTFFLNFLTPQQNALGRLQDPYCYSNPIYYVAQLNRELCELVRSRRNMYYIDADQISSGLGKRFIQDDSVSHLNHGSTLSNIGMGSEGRIEPIGDVPALYSARVKDFNQAVYDEILAAFRSIRQHGAIKLVIFDLDDTLWRGVAAERADDLGIDMTEGWPLGLLEAASFLHKRGILISIVSKNDDSNVVDAWNALYEHRFSLDNFVGRQVNWGSKVENILKVLELTNVGADATLFVDDNPVERERVRQALPEIRVLEGPLAEWRRQLLWSAELQPPVITDESLGRTASIRAKATRDDEGRQLSRDDFLDRLGLAVTPSTIVARSDPGFARCLDLINKTNQFNTTERRWTEAELERLFQAGGWLLALSVKDRYAAYGVTAVAVCQGAQIVQFVMSCRVFGLGVEDAALALATSRLRSAGAAEPEGRISATDRNHLSTGLYGRLGVEDQGDGRWRRPAGTAVPAPSHVVVADASS